MESEEQEVARQLGTNLILKEKIGQGAFGQVFGANHKAYPRQLAIKVEWKKNEDSEATKTLLREAKILRELRDTEGIPSVKEYKSAEKLRYLVMDRLGPSVANLLKHCHGGLSLKTTLMLFDQLVTRLESVHNKGFIHRDIKPENFVVGDEKAQNTVYLIDFGISKSFRSKEGRVSSIGVHISQKRRTGLIGTARFASVAAHRKLELSRKDDLESLGYSIVYLFKGTLPWIGLESVMFDERIEEIKLMKESISLEALCQGLPKEFCLFFEYVKTLNFSESPSYSHIRKLITRMMFTNGYQFDHLYDWVLKEGETMRLPSLFHAISSDLLYRIEEARQNQSMNSPMIGSLNLKNVMGKRFKSSTILLQTPGPPTISIPVRRFSKKQAVSDQNLCGDTKSSILPLSLYSPKDKFMSGVGRSSHLDMLAHLHFNSSPNMSSVGRKPNPKNKLMMSIHQPSTPSKSKESLISISSYKQLDPCSSDLSELDEVPDLPDKMLSLTSFTKLTKGSTLCMSKFAPSKIVKKQ